MVCTTEVKYTNIMNMRFSPDGKRLAAYGPTGRSLSTLVDEVHVLDVDSGREVAPPLKGTGIVAHFEISPDGNRLATGSYDGTVKVWDFTTGQETLTLKGHTGEITALAFSLDGYRLITAAKDLTVRVWDATPLPEERR